MTVCFTDACGQKVSHTGCNLSISFCCLSVLLDNFFFFLGISLFSCGAKLSVSREPDNASINWGKINFCHFLLDVSFLCDRFLIFKNEMVLTENNISQLKFYIYSVIPSMGFSFFSVCSGLDPAKSCVCSNETPMKVLNSIWKLRHA